jgi:GT2 family glycosyltransferase
LAKPEHWDLRVYLADDGSSDGTADAVLGLPVSLKVVKGPGDWYWAQSMHQAELAIDEPYDAILWLNDDVLLEQGALLRFAEWNTQYPSSILIGQFYDPETGALTYGGLRRVGRHPFRFTKLRAEVTPEQADTMHGNLVLIPRSVTEAVGTIDGGFAHAYADHDYGYRATARGFDLLAVPGFAGPCALNVIHKPNTVKERLHMMHSKKGIPPKSQIRFLRRHGGVTWPIYFLAPYVRALLKS